MVRSRSGSWAVLIAARRRYAMRYLEKTDFGGSGYFSGLLTYPTRPAPRWLTELKLETLSSDADGFSHRLGIHTRA